MTIFVMTRRPRAAPERRRVPDDDALDAGEIATRRDVDRSPPSASSARHGRRLTGADLEDERPRRARRTRGASGIEPAVGVEAVGAAVERETRLASAPRRASVAISADGTYGGLLTTRSKRARRRRARRSSRSTRRRRDRATPSPAAFALPRRPRPPRPRRRPRRPSRRAARPRAQWRWRRCRCRDRARGAAARGRRRAASARSTTSSVSGRGTSTSAVTASASDQNSRRPVRCATGSPVAAAADERAIGVDLGASERLVEAQIDADPVGREHVREQQLGVEPRRSRTPRPARNFAASSRYASAFSAAVSPGRPARSISAPSSALPLGSAC